MQKHERERPESELETHEFRVSYWLIAAIVILAFSVISMIYLKVANASIAENIVQTNTQISDLERSVQTLRDDRRIRAYEYYDDAKSEIDETIRLSMVQRYITEFLRVSEKYRIEFSGFSYAGDRISTSAQSRDLGDVRFDSAEKVSRMIRDYRTDTDDTLFLLSPILSLSGDDETRDFGIVFDIDTLAVSKRINEETEASESIESLRDMEAWESDENAWDDAESLDSE